MPKKIAIPEPEKGLKLLVLLDNEVLKMSSNLLVHIVLMK